MTPRIQQLPANIASKIAAGEVVERPGSVVKELLENSIDAGASAIAIDVLEGGRDLIRIVDDGSGIDAEDLTLAVASHATSKLRHADDLFRIATMGFRGEALSSIAGVSDFRLQSRPPHRSVGARIEVRQGIPNEAEECGCPPGTQIEVRNLFESVPVRRKFLKSRQTELGHVTEAVIRIALAHPNVALTLRHNERLLYERGTSLDRLETIRIFFGREIADSLIPVESDDDGVALRGFVADPSVSRPTNRLAYLFVNGRFIRDRSLGHAVQEAFRGLLLTGRYPVSFLFLDMPSDRVDVNVHPMKIEVRFEEPRRIYSQILATIRERFLEADLSARFQPMRAKTLAPSTAGSLGHQDVNESFMLQAGGERQPSLWSRPVAQMVTSAVAMAPALKSHSDRNQGMAEAHEDFDEFMRVVESSSSQPMQSDSLPPDVVPIREPGPTEWIIEDAASKVDQTSPTPPTSGPSERIRAIQLHDSYLVVETEEGMLLVDQHALHERILYEELRHRVDGQAVEIQDLLVPEPVELTPVQAGLLLEQKELLAQMGLVLEEFGERTVLVRGYPVLLRKTPPAELVLDLACQLEETGRLPSRERLLDDILHMTACKAAVKAGDPLTTEEIESLLRRRRDVDDSHHCPHGRPTVLRFTLGDLERQFQRK